MASEPAERPNDLSNDAKDAADFDDDLENGEATEPDEALAFKYAITSYGADYPVDSLVKRVKSEDVHIPLFQRNYIWPLTRASRFVESLLLGLPVPGIFLSRERETGKLLVIDGQQRLLTLRDFYNGIFMPTGRRFALADLASRFEGLTYKTLPDDDRRRLDDSIIHATVVRQDEPSEDDSSVYLIFVERARTCIFHSFNEITFGR